MKQVISGISCHMKYWQTAGVESIQFVKAVIKSTAGHQGHRAGQFVISPGETG